MMRLFKSLLKRQRPVPVANPIPDTRPRFSPRTPKHVAECVDRACLSGKWLIAVFRIENGKIILDRHATDFPVEDIDGAMRRLVEDVQILKAQ